jgi:hypothetical protein
MIDEKFKNMINQNEVDLVNDNNQKLLANVMDSSLIDADTGGQ